VALLLPAAAKTTTAVYNKPSAFREKKNPNILPKPLHPVI